MKGSFCWDEVAALEQWSGDNHLSLNVSKTKKIIVDYRKRGGVHSPVTINGTVIERVDILRYLGVNIHKDLIWTCHTTALIIKAQQHLFVLRGLRKFGLSPRILRDFYQGTMESLSTGCFTTWYGNCTSKEQKDLGRVVRMA